MAFTAITVTRSEWNQLRVLSPPPQLAMLPGVAVRLAVLAVMVVRTCS